MNFLTKYTIKIYVTYIIALISISFLLIIFYTNYDYDYYKLNMKNIARVIQSRYGSKGRNESNTYKSILYWNKFFRWNDMRLGLGKEIFEKCPVNKCFTTNNKTLLPVDQFDAIIFHTFMFNRKNDGVPTNRNLDQRYIFFTLEAGVRCSYDKEFDKDFFNWTMSYRRDSDIHYPYALARPMKTKYKVREKTYLNTKTKQVAWFVSNCISKRRNEYVKELSKYIPVDVYGKCGNLSCPRTNESLCYDMLERDYKFYLAFENSMCVDYVTEKLFQVLSYDVVPVVLGLADYKAIAPPNSFINVDDFQSPLDLANYLWGLSEDSEAYLSYFNWKKDYVIDNYNYTYVLCQICQKLHEPPTYSSYENVRKWFTKCK